MNPLVVGTYNMWADAVRNRPEKVKEDLGTLLSKCHAITLQEGGPGRVLLEETAHEFGCSIYRGDGKVGQSSTPVLIRKGITILDSKSFPLTDSTRVGPNGAGPNVMLAKWLNIVKIRMYGRRIWIGSIHATPSVYIPERHRLVEEQFRDSAKALDTLRGIKILGGDLNTEPDNKLRSLLNNAGIVSSQRTLKQIDTKDNRSIDDIYYTNDERIIPIEHHVMNLTSDHDAYLVNFNINPTWRYRLQK